MKERMTKEQRAEMVRIAVTTQDRETYDNAMSALGYRHAQAAINAAARLGVRI